MSELKTILLIDDDPVCLTAMKQTLESTYRVLIGPTPNDGLKLAVEYRPDLIITDLSMEKMTGFEIIESYREQTGLDTPFVVVSGYRSSTFEQRLADLGILYYLDKPVSSDELLEFVAAVFSELNP